MGHSNSNLLRRSQAIRPPRTGIVNPSNGKKDRKLSEKIGRKADRPRARGVKWVRPLWSHLTNSLHLSLNYWVSSNKLTALLLNIFRDKTLFLRRTLTTGTRVKMCRRTFISSHTFRPNGCNSHQVASCLRRQFLQCLPNLSGNLWLRCHKWIPRSSLKEWRANLIQMVGMLSWTTPADLSQEWVTTKVTQTGRGLINQRASRPLQVVPRPPALLLRRENHGPSGLIKVQEVDLNHHLLPQMPRVAKIKSKTLTFKMADLKMAKRQMIKERPRRLETARRPLPILLLRLPRPEAFWSRLLLSPLHKRRYLWIKLVKFQCPTKISKPRARPNPWNSTVNC